jgi:hypothetical protein
MTYLLFAVALSLSAVAAWYAIAGLCAIFAAAVIPIAIMGSLLEASKLVVASWLYRNWKEIPKLMKAYFTVSLVILMMLTSMGIFGFLSKAHLDQAIPTGDVQSKLALIDEKIKTEKENIDASRKELNQLDLQVNETISRSANTSTNPNTSGGASAGTSGVERSIAIRRAQQKDRERILKEIGAAQAKIASLNEERAPIASEVRKVEAEVGPIKYIAAVLYGDNPDANVLEKAVRIVTMLIVVVFDPLAVLMLIAANWNVIHSKKRDLIDAGELPEEKHPSINDFVPQPQEFIPEPQQHSINLEDNTEVVSDTIVSTDLYDRRKSYEESSEEDLAVTEHTHTKDWEPELFNTLPNTYSTPKANHFMTSIREFLKPNRDTAPGVSTKTIEYDSAGRRITPTTEEERAKSIEKEVDELQTKNPK